MKRAPAPTLPTAFDMAVSIADNLAALPVKDPLTIKDVAEIIRIIGGNKEVFTILDTQATKIGLDRGKGHWHWKVRQVRNRWADLLFATFTR